MGSATDIERTDSQTGLGKKKQSVQAGLTKAFVTFTQAAGSLERSYTQLQGEVARLHSELKNTNAELDRSLEENARVRAYLGQVLENLPCGVVVAGAKNDQVQVLNPEARRLLRISPEWKGTSGEKPSPLLEKLFVEQPEGKDPCELEWAGEGSSDNRTIAISRSHLSPKSDEGGDRIWIIRDITEQKRIAAEREATRRSMALAEVATLLAHEIRNPLGSMELFTGLLADTAANSQEARQWVNHLRAGLRSLSATVNNVLQFHSQGVVQLVPTDLERLLTDLSDFLLPMARQRGQQIKFENSIGRIIANVDGNRLKQVFLNLSLNAFRAMPPGGTLRIHMGWAPQFPGGLVRIELHDEGRGIASELLGSGV